MHELQKIHDAVNALLKAQKAGLLVTVIATRGSTYRRPGARSVIGEDGSIAGAISGGCVERDIALRATRLKNKHIELRIDPPQAEGPRDVEEQRENRAAADEEGDKGNG